MADIEKITDSLVLRLTARAAMVLSPFVFAAGGWLILSYLSHLDGQFEAGAKADEQIIQYIDRKTELLDNRINTVQTKNIEVQTKLTESLTQVNLAASAQQATSAAQYNELKDDIGDNDRRIDRLEDRILPTINR